ncbi:MAG: endonuclease/exonuclease/phosphatase family protein [Clostridiales bacterium]|nr:endonuclease/exonuclease/phosphatase family protein [Clostridiales bacterium]
MKLKTILKAAGIILAILLILILGYVAYVFFTYNRIEDKQALTPEGTASLTELQTGTSYTAVTSNMGFGAYTADFTFFMDGGSQSWASSKESVIDCIQQGAEKALSFSPDFVLFQEIDTDSTRSYHVNEMELMNSSFDNYTHVFAVNYHSAFLMYPFYQPHGKSNSGILTYSRAPVTSAVRRQLEISTTLSKFVDLDRCYSVSRIPVEGGKELVLYNVHLSAYGGNDQIRTSQMTMLFQDMKAEYDAGNYTVCGGDFNHDFTGDSTMKLNNLEGSDFGWAQPFPADLLPEGISRCMDYSGDQLIPTTRNCDIPYGDDSMTIILDGFLVSDNVQVDMVENIDTGFVYSDHNPVVLKFTLLP